MGAMSLFCRPSRTTRRSEERRGGKECALPISADRRAHLRRTRLERPAPARAEILAGWALCHFSAGQAGQQGDRKSVVEGKSVLSRSPLTVEPIFGAPDLSGPRLREPKFSPDGRYVTFLQAKQDNKDQLDLWAFDTRTGKARLLVDSRELVSGEEKLSAEEEARRERQ